MFASFIVIDYLVVDHLSFILVQFIFGLIFSFFGICIFVLTIIYLKKNKIKTSEDLDRLMEFQKAEKLKLLKEKKELKEKEEKLLIESMRKEYKIMEDTIKRATIGILVQKKAITEEEAKEILKADNDIEDEK